MRAICCVLLLTLLAACQPTGAGGEKVSHPREITGPGSRISVFLQAEGRLESCESVGLSIAGLDARRGQVWVPLFEGRRQVRLDRNNGGQALLGRAVLPPDIYAELRLRVEGAVCEANKGARILSGGRDYLHVPLATAVSLSEGSSETVLIRWSVEKALKEEGVNAASMAAAPAATPLNADLLYAACPDIDTVYLISTVSNRVVGSIGVPGRPASLALDQGKNRLWVLGNTPVALHMFELPSLRRQDMVRLPSLREGSHLTVDPDGERAWVADQGGGSVFRLSLVSGGIEARARLNERPVRTYFLEGRRQLAVATSSSREVFLLDDRTLEVRTKVPGARNARGIAVFEETLFLTSPEENALLAYNLRTGQTRKLHVGSAPARLLLHDRLLYAANSGESSVSVVLPGQLQSLRLLETGAGPGEMAVAPIQRRLYVANRGNQGFTVLDLNTGQTVAVISLETVPDALAVL